MRLDLADLQLFMCIVETGSITQGAIKAHLALASASERLRLMEADVGVPLLVRHPRGVTLTGAGETLAKYARPLLEQHQQLRRELKTFASGVRGTLKLYANTSALTAFLPARLAPWLASHPDVHIELEERTSEDIIALLLAGSGNAGIVSDAVDTSGLTTEPIANDHLVVIVPPGHTAYGKQAVSFTDIIHEPFVGLYPGSALQDHICTHAGALGNDLNLRVRMSTFEGLCEMVEKGIGFGIVPAVIADKYHSRFRFHSLTLSDRWARRTLCICYRSWQALDPGMKSLVRHLKTA
ncbi:LysR family transcriptional regulator [Superficieibacter electus]|uniref:LysR family transcriptional regulator n=1 Tax=Superficieibacter electus TaxID=2022662 RepID=A0A2P5GNL0_9ENTR|nr:LysR family transcriptional regulator [Superficieibacter electus]POP43658.1 LysR family transcriptional regulator [Superficieibacter electus]POP48126.1 LysR family transcriptional regulator [Superficieibacter electus]